MWGGATWPRNSVRVLKTIPPVVSIAQSEEAWMEETEDEEETIAEGLLLLALLPRPRAPLTARAKLKWDRELNMLLAESQFEACYRVPTAAFVRVEAVLAPLLLRSHHAWVRRGWIACDNALQLTLRYLAGGLMRNIRRIAGVSKATFYRIVWLVVDAINAAKELCLEFPRSPTARKAAASAFKTLSAQGVFSGCVGCLDGWICSTRAPRLAETDRSAIIAATIAAME
ncbi:unnamed protein product [Phytophthora fragariaefolia]|uniref:Unnamed protein product n=1 Tax=Phytophthora fragariaefolia TaxID=1490495 RepID=A0A9W6UE21_9STRA|nr:unnamed protein product [Phytophthora fragariaefolia]